MKVIRRYWIYLVILIIVILFLVRSVLITADNYRLANSGKVGTAVIENKKWESSSHRNEDGFYYSFEVDGEVYTGHTFDQDKKPLDTIRILYLEGKPSINRPYDFIKRNY